jgi:hypothetical protein
MEFEELPLELKQSVEDAETYAIAATQDNTLFSPYIFLGSNAIQKIIADDIDEAIEMAQEEIEAMGEETVVFVYRDIVKLADGSFDAIVTQLFNVDEDNGYSFGLIYKIADDKISFLNKRIFLGNIRNCLVY